VEAHLLGTATNLGRRSKTPDTALTTLAEKGVPDWVIRAQFRHVSPVMMAVNSHVRRRHWSLETLAPPRTETRRQRVTSHVTAAPVTKQRDRFSEREEAGPLAAVRRGLLALQVDGRRVQQLLR
jgi:hypothetical protein